MAETTEISWCDSTHNDWKGCTKKSPACANCFAAAYGRRWGIEWGPGKPRVRNSEATRRKPRKWERDHEKFFADHGRRQRVFCGSLCDWLDHEVPIEWLADLLALIAATPHLDWLLLTKRPERWSERLWKICEMFQLGNDPLADYPEDARVLVYEWVHDGKPPANAWMGVTVENNDYRWRAEKLLGIPARLHFISYEPALGALDLRGYLHLAPCPQAPGAEAFRDMPCDCREHRLKREHIGWVICGGESGPNARPMQPGWAHSMRDQCKAAGVPFMMKQMGGHPNKRGKLEDLPADLRVRQFPVVA